MPSTHQCSSERRGAHWHIWRAADELNASPLLETESGKSRYCRLLPSVTAILENWGHRWAGHDEWQSFLNKATLKHEVEEALVALATLLEWLKAASTSDVVGRVTLLDVCAGKGTLAMLLSYLAATGPDCPLSNVWSRISRVVMIEKMSINWHHIAAANEDYRMRSQIDVSQPAKDVSKEDLQSDVVLGAIPIDIWSGCNIHDESIIERVHALNGQIIMVGIHLCKTLSPRCISIYNALGAAKAPFLLLAPCCVPVTKAKSEIPVLQFETELERKARLALRSRRFRASRASRQWACPTYEEDDSERLQLTSDFQDVCWRCGQPGHVKADCSESQTSSRPRRAPPPVCNISMGDIAAAEWPFEAWVASLQAVVQGPPGSTSMLEVPLEAHGDSKDTQNWNRFRKCSWIVSARS